MSLAWHTDKKEVMLGLTLRDSAKVGIMKGVLTTKSKTQSVLPLSCSQPSLTLEVIVVLMLSFDNVSQISPSLSTHTK